MKYAWVDDGNGNGPVTGLNRGAMEGEIEGTCTPQELVWGYLPQYYKVVSEVLKAFTASEKDDYDWIADKDNALEVTLSNIDGQCSEENLKDFPYKKGEEEEYNYVADNDSIQAVAIECYSYAEEDPIPVPNGVWKTNDTLSDGLTPIYVPYTCGEFKAFKSAYYMRSSDNFGVKEYHKNVVKTMYKDNETSGDDLLNYDYTQGWN